MSQAIRVVELFGLRWSPTGWVLNENAPVGRVTLTAVGGKFDFDDLSWSNLVQELFEQPLTLFTASAEVGAAQPKLHADAVRQVEPWTEEALHLLLHDVLMQNSLAARIRSTIDR